MIKAVLTSTDGKTTVLLLGLSHSNLHKLEADGLDGFIKIDGKEIGIPLDILITAGETEQSIRDGLKGFIGPRTVVEDRRGGGKTRPA